MRDLVVTKLGLEGWHAVAALHHLRHYPVVRQIIDRTPGQRGPDVAFQILSMADHARHLGEDTLALPGVAFADGDDHRRRLGRRGCRCGGRGGGRCGLSDGRDGYGGRGDLLESPRGRRYDAGRGGSARRNGDHGGRDQRRRSDSGHSMTANSRGFPARRQGAYQQQGAQDWRGAARMRFAFAC